MERSGMRVGLLRSRLRVEERRLGAALSGRGAEVIPLPEDAAAFDLQARGYDGLDVVLERCQDYTLAQTALRALEHLGVPTVNRPATVDMCGNKVLMSAALIRAGLPTPRVEIALAPEAALLASRAARALGGGVLEVDLFESDRGLLINEVSTITHFRSFETRNGVDVAAAIADYVVAVAGDSSDAQRGMADNVRA